MPIPKPFSRPIVEVGSTGPKKSWRNVPAEELIAGDIVGGAGVVLESRIEGDTVLVSAGSDGAAGSVKEYRVGSPVWVFH